MKGKPHNKSFTLPEGVTYRQLNYWLTQLFGDDTDLVAGTGLRRDLTPYEKRALEYMSQLRKVGMENKLAARMARGFATGPMLAQGHIQPNLVVSFDEFMSLLTKPIPAVQIFLEDGHLHGR